MLRVSNSSCVSRTTLTINLCHVLQVNFSQSSIRVTNLGTPPALGLSFSLLPSIISSENIDTNIHKQQLIILANNHIKMIRGMKIMCAFVVVAMMLLNSSYGFVVQPHWITPGQRPKSSQELNYRHKVLSLRKVTASWGE